MKLLRLPAYGYVGLSLITLPPKSATYYTLIAQTKPSPYLFFVTKDKLRNCITNCMNLLFWPVRRLLNHLWADPIQKGGRWVESVIRSQFSIRAHRQTNTVTEFPKVIQVESPHPVINVTITHFS